jgi:transcriptional regulator with XRE-family HTH domain
MPFTASVTQRAVAHELAQAREDRGLSIRDVASRTAWHNSKVSRIESARTKASATDVTKLGEIYEADGGTVARWIEMAQDDISGAWWQRYERWLAASFVEFLTFESEAVRAWSVQHMFVPGMLQTSDYIRALHMVGPLRDPGRNDAEYEVRLRRQRRLHGADPLIFHALLAESALHWRFGSREILHDQLVHLRDMSQLENVHIRVVSFARPAIIYPTDFFELPRSGSVAFGEASWGTPMYDDPLDLAEARREIERVEAAALSEEETNKLLEQRIRETRE